MPRSTPHPPTVRAVYSHHSGLHIIASNCTLYHNSISHPNSAARLQTNSEKRSSTSVPFSPHLTSLRLLAVKYTDYFKISLLVRNFPTSETSSVKGHSRCLGAQTRPACSPQAAPRFELPFFQSWNICGPAALESNTTRPSGIKNQVLNCRGLRHGCVEDLAQVVEWPYLIRGRVVLSFSAEVLKHQPSPLTRTPRDAATDGTEGSWGAGGTFSGGLDNNFWFVPQPEECYEKNVTVMKNMSLWKLHWTDSR